MLGAWWFVLYYHVFLSESGGGIEKSGGIVSQD
jgi:hypothetical protein